MDGRGKTPVCDKPKILPKVKVSRRSLLNFQKNPGLLPESRNLGRTIDLELTKKIKTDLLALLRRCPKRKEKTPYNKIALK